MGRPNGLVITIYGYFIFAFLLLTSGAFEFASSRIRANTIKSLEESVIYANLLVEKEQQYLYGIAQYYSIAPEVQSTLSQSNAGASIHGLSDELLSISKSRMYVLDLVLYNRYGDPVGFYSIDNSSGPVSQSRYDESRPFYRLIHGEKPFEWEFIDKNQTTYFETDNSPKLCLWYVVKSTQSMKPIGVIAVSLDTRKLLSTDNVFNDELYSNLVLLDNDGTVVFSRNPSITGMSIEAKDLLLSQVDPYTKSGSFSLRFNGEQYLSVFRRVPNSTFTTFVLNHYRPFTMDRSTILVFASAFAVVAILLLPIVIFIYRKLTKPLLALNASMKQYGEGERSVRVVVEDPLDEIGQLSSSFNRMVEENNTLIENNYLLKIREQEAALASQQAQINPHFLYNVINHLQWSALQRNEEELAEIAYSMGQVFRISLNHGESMLPISQECLLIRYFVSLHELRFEGRVQFSMQVDEELLPLMIPKLIIQPLVENSILHGVGNSTDTIQLCVRITNAQGPSYIRIVVRDNGIGIPPEVLKDLPDHLPEPQIKRSSGSGFALKNISQRLKLTYGTDYRFDIRSTVGEFTEITLEIPKEQSHPQIKE